MKVYCENTSCGADLTERKERGFMNCPECLTMQTSWFGGHDVEDHSEANEIEIDEEIVDEYVEISTECLTCGGEATSGKSGDWFWCNDCNHWVDEDGECGTSDCETCNVESDVSGEALSNLVPDLLNPEKTRALDVSNPTLKEFAIKLLALLQNKVQESHKNRTLYAYPVQQTIEAALKPYDVYKKDMEHFFHSISRSWDENKIYFPGDSLVRINFSSGYKKGFMTLIAGVANSRIDPYNYFTNHSTFEKEIWRLFVEVEGDLSEYDTRLESFQSKTTELESLKNTEISLNCYSCNTSHKLKLGLLSDEHSPSKGHCSDCKSVKHTVSLVGQNGKSVNTPVIFDSISEQFLISFSNEMNRIDIREVWEEYQRSGAIGMIDFHPGDPAESMADLLKTELKLHRISAELYAKLRGIPVTNPNNNMRSKGLLRELDWLNEQVKLFVEKVEKN